jgi:hypothetical protein
MTKWKRMKSKQLGGEPALPFFLKSGFFPFSKSDTFQPRHFALLRRLIQDHTWCIIFVCLVAILPSMVTLLVTLHIWRKHNSFIIENVKKGRKEDRKEG